MSYKTRKNTDPKYNIKLLLNKFDHPQSHHCHFQRSNGEARSFMMREVKTEVYQFLSISVCFWQFRIWQRGISAYGVMRADADPTLQFFWYMMQSKQKNILNIVPQSSQVLDLRAFKNQLSPHRPSEWYTFTYIRICTRPILFITSHDCVTM